MGMQQSEVFLGMESGPDREALVETDGMEMGA